MHYFQRWWQVRSLFGVTKDSFCSCLFTLYIRELIFILPLFLYSAHSSSADAPHLDITIHIKRTLIVHRLTTDNNCFFFGWNIANMHSIYNIHLDVQQRASATILLSKSETVELSEGWFVDWCCGIEHSANEHQETRFIWRAIWRAFYANVIHVIQSLKQWYRTESLIMAQIWLTRSHHVQLLFDVNQYRPTPLCV